jgi:hypothetical protein
MVRFLPWKLVSRSLAILLLAAAFFKMNGLGFETVASRGIFSGPEFQIALVEVEIILGIWLLWGKNPVGAWLVSLVLFSAFAAASFYQGWIGEASCGCFGRVSVNPWITFGLDLVVLAALVVGRPPLKTEGRIAISKAIVPMAWLFGGVLAFLALLVGVTYLFFGSTDAALAYFRGERLSIRPRLVDVGEGSAGEYRTETLDLVNRTDQPIRVVGGTSDCSCIVTNDLPITIAPGRTHTISVTIHLPQTEGIFTRKAVLITDHDRTRTIRFLLTGRICNPDDSSLAQGN